MKKFGLKALFLCLFGFFAGGFLTVLGFTLATKVLGLPAWKQDISLNSTNDQSYFSVDGTATIETVPDQAVINLGVETTADTVALAQNETNTVIANLQTQLTALGLEKKDLQTSNYSLYPVYDWEDGDGNNIIGYTISSTLQVTCTDFAILNQVIDAATAVGINQINGINFGLSESKQVELKKEARTTAIAQAKDNAAELTSLTGIKLGNIINVYEYQPQNDIVSNSLYAKNLASTDSVSYEETNVEAGTASFTYQVTLTYKTY